MRKNKNMMYEAKEKTAYKVNKFFYSKNFYIPTPDLSF